MEEAYADYRASGRKRRSWAVDNPGNAAIRAELLAAVVELAGTQLDGGGKVLDVGCGGGRLLERFAQRGVEQSRLHGVDLIESRLSAARRHLPEADLRRADARKLPYADGEFELATLLTCLSSMPDRDAVRRALAETRRILAPGGLLLCYEPHVPNPFNRSTLTVSPRLLQQSLGRPIETRRLTAFPPLVRHLGRLNRHLYPTLSSLIPTHTLTAWIGGPHL